jgi:hypothetical protein
MSAPRDTELECPERACPERACPERACIDLECNETMGKNDLFERSRPVQNDADGFWEALFEAEFEEWKRKQEPSPAMSSRMLRAVESYRNGDHSSFFFSDSGLGDPFHQDCMHDASPDLSRGNEIVEGFSDFYGGSL